MQKVIFQHLGLIEYKEAWNKQEEIFDLLVQQKLANRDLPEEQREKPQHHLLFCEHYPVFTLGKNGKEENMLFPEHFLKEKGIGFYKINRGGDITHHSPGQIVGYPILDLDDFFTDIDKYLRKLEDMVIFTLEEYGIKGERLKGATGVWLEPENPFKARKICAMGVRCSRWVTMHGFALNINTDLSYFDLIVPCGLQGKQVTSMEKEIGRNIPMEEVEEKLKHHFSKLFNVNLEEVAKSALGD